MNVWREVKARTVGQGCLANGTAQASSAVTGPPREKMVGEHMVGPWQNPAVPGGQRGPWSTHRGRQFRPERLLVWPCAAERSEAAGEGSSPDHGGLQTGTELRYLTSPEGAGSLGQARS